MKSQRTKKPNLNPDAAYENVHLVARDLVERVNELLHDMPAPGDDDHPVDWGHVGSINHVNSLLDQIVAFLENRDE